MAANCPRGEGGFCLVALIGHPLCPSPRGDGRCDVKDGEAAYAEAYDRAITRIYRDWRRRQRRRR